MNKRRTQTTTYKNYDTMQIRRHKEINTATMMRTAITKYKRDIPVLRFTAIVKTHTNTISRYTSPKCRTTNMADYNTTRPNIRTTLRTNKWALIPYQARNINLTSPGRNWSRSFSESEAQTKQYSTTLMSHKTWKQTTKGGLESVYPSYTHIQ